MSLRNSLTEILQGEFLNKVVSDKSFDRLVNIVHHTLPGNLDYATVYESCRHLVDTPLHLDLLKTTAWRLAGNLPRLRRFRAVTPWVVQRFNEWVPLHIESVDESRNMSGKFGANITMRIIAGTPCSLKITQWWSMSLFRYRAQKMHFSRRHPLKYPFKSPRDMVTLRLYALIEPKRCKPETPGFYHVSFPPSVSAWNREQVRHTFRVDTGYTCPMGYSRETPCRSCAIGYTSCRGGKHAKDYEFKPCPVCHEEEAPFDPDKQGQVCVNCRLEAVVLKKGFHT